MLGETLDTQTRKQLRSLPAFPPAAKVGEGFRKKGKHARPSLSNTFIFWLSIYLFTFTFFFFLERMSWNTQVSSQSRVSRGGGGQEITSPSPSQKPSGDRRWTLARTCISEATVLRTKGTQKEPRRRRARPVPSALLCLLYSPLGFVSSCISTFSAGVFLTRPDCLLISTISTVLRAPWEREGSPARRGGREGR